MGEAQEMQLGVMRPTQEAREENSPQDANRAIGLTLHQQKNFGWWLLVALYSFLILAGQSVATLLGRLYFEKGGNSKWMATLVQPSGFLVLLPLYFLSSTPSTSTPAATNISSSKNSQYRLVLASIYVSFGIFQAGNYMLYSLGLLYLPVSTFSLICASQLGFNAMFSFFLNSQKFTPLILNSLVLLTISSVLLVCQDDSTESKHVSRGKYIIGFISTAGASAAYGLNLSLTQVVFRKVLKQETFKVVLDMIFYPALVSTVVVTVGLFASGEWKDLSREMGEFELGKTSYLMTLIWTAVTWQVFSIGCVGLIFKVSSLFSNVISTVGLPIVPVLAVIFFRDEMNGIKVIAMMLAVWGFVSYIYQHYIDDRMPKTEGCGSPTQDVWILRKME
ncbi:hypothetical protein Tsubulata_007135 [Turnera subulata]|uniref:Probable purine permease n=1 Tax=Turnera subulata TaxID=218843 RepID=A0A9Q0F6I4_9ROSI|nr:hypothetical protein Tsubulata_007135 [Turnera subulata]